MNALYRTLFTVFGMLVIAACSGGDDHGHAHDEGADHSHDTMGSTAEQADDGHAHGANTHTHENMPETEVFYGDGAAASSEPEAKAGHAHGDDTHTHDEDDAAPDEHTHDGSEEPHTHEN